MGGGEDGGGERNRLIMLVRARLVAMYAFAQLLDKQTHSLPNMGEGSA